MSSDSVVAGLAEGTDVLAEGAEDVDGLADQVDGFSITEGLRGPEGVIVGPMISDDRGAMICTCNGSQEALDRCAIVTDRLNLSGTPAADQFAAARRNCHALATHALARQEDPIIS